MKLYSLAVNAREICAVEVETPAWLPVRPQVPDTWLASLVTRALSFHFAASPSFDWSGRRENHWN